MGGSSFIPHLLDVHPGLENLIVYEDNFVREQRLKHPDLLSQVLLAPLWKIRSAYHDSMTPIAFKVDQFGSVKIDVSDQDFFCISSIGNLNHTTPRTLMEETATCAHLYSQYIWQLKKILGNIRRFLRRTLERKTQMIDSFYEEASSSLEFIRYANRIIYIMEVSFLFLTAIKESILNAMSVLRCSCDNLYLMARFYYNSNLQLPSLSSLALNYMQHFLSIRADIECSEKSDVPYNKHCPWEFFKDDIEELAQTSL